MPTEIEIQITPLFSTPLLVFTPADHTRINARLSTMILEREASVPAHRDNEVVGWSSPHDLSMLEWAGEPLRDLFAPVLEVAKQVTTLSQRCGQGTGRPEWDVVEVWANVQRNGGTNAAHSHPGSFWAGVYYVDVGEVSSNKDMGGELQIYDPRGCLPRMLAPYLQYSMTELHDAGTSISYAPTSGQCVLFPGWLFHAVNTYHGKAPRISVAFNLDPVLAPGMMNGTQKRPITESRR
ncbi:MAG: 2OG-Fe(II) oxygenase family protein [Nitrospira sp.]|nr:2OG-Fe(II) oxygenase family protein [Nitrospira sp.]MBX3342250.1 2OG-Fe(II) oxygenase family protein [Nitrospira sp.]MBX3370598.1 2OG-Fe(II) oxygenase family protein [Nitrospira sp.]MBX7040704.1 2OG-Fe(II) oxygenase family protein [Nitrospira sp.]MCW5793811.1 2OG-Fe(II) oxygenase family protein [Nitrospira sp.]